MRPSITITARWLEHPETLAARRGCYSFAARCLFTGLDVFYGHTRTLENFRVLELSP